MDGSDASRSSAREGSRQRSAARELLFRLFAMLLGAAGGCLGAVLLTGLWFHVMEPRLLTSGQRAALARRLAADPAAIYMFDSACSYRFKPSYRGVQHGECDGCRTNKSHRTNSRGLLGAAELPPAGKAKRILFLGDSVAYGQGVPYPSTIIPIMGRMAGPGYHLANGSCPGWTTLQEIRFWEVHQSDVPWDLLVFVFCPNDLVRFEWVYSSERHFQMAPALKCRGGLYATEKLRIGASLFGLRRRLAADSATAPLLGQLNTCLYAWLPEQWDLYEREVLAPFLRRHDRPPTVFVVVPTRDQAEALRRGASPLVAGYPGRELARRAGAFGVAVIDATEVFTEAPLHPGHQFRDAWHLHSRGHERVARFVWPRLRSLIEGAAPSSGASSAPPPARSLH